MKKLTIFTAPKPFTDRHIAMIQRNAIRSWLEMGDVEVLLMGDEAGMAEVAAELGATRVSNITTNEDGTPLVSSIFRQAHEVGTSGLFMFANTDMLFLPETLDLVTGVKKRSDRFVLLGQRCDLEIQQPIDFSQGWPQRLREEVHSRGKVHPLGGSDYFIYPRGLFSELPGFAIGRAGWDNWMIYNAVSQDWQVVDATPSLLAVHQNHGYSHLAGFSSHYRHPETMKNLELAGGMRHMCSLLDVTYQLVNGQIRPAPPTLARALRRIERWLQPDALVGNGPRWWLLRAVRRLRRALLRSGNQISIT